MEGLPLFMVSHQLVLFMRLWRTAHACVSSSLRSRCYFGRLRSIASATERGVGKRTLACRHVLFRQLLHSWVTIGDWKSLRMSL